MNRLILAGALLGSLLMSNTASADSLPQSQVSLTQGASNTWNADWVGVSGRTYFVQVSTDLVNWSYAPSVDFGSGLKSLGVDSGGVPKFFLRLKYVDVPGITTQIEAESADFDGDGYSNLFEVTVLATDPFLKDTDGNGVADGAESLDGDDFPDAWELYHYGNLTTLTNANADVDTDGDGLTTRQEAQMRTNPGVNEAAQGSQRSDFTYSTMGRIQSVDGPVSGTFSFDSESNLLSAP